MRAELLILTADDPMPLRSGTDGTPAQGYQAHYLRLAAEQQRLLEILGEMRWTLKKAQQEAATGRALRFLSWQQTTRLELTLPDVLTRVQAVVKAAHPDKHGGDDPVGTEVMKVLLPLRESLRMVLEAIQESPHA